MAHGSNQASREEDQNHNGFPYPSCWQNKERVANLMAAFSERSVNEENYDSKLKFWVDIIGVFCEYKGTAIFNKKDLQIQFTQGSGVPRGLDTVFDHMQCMKVTRLYPEYMCDPLNTWSGWAVNSFVKRPSAWILQKLKSIVGILDASALGTLQYVHLPTIKKFCEQLQVNVLAQQEGKLMHFHILNELVQQAALQLEDETLVLCLITLHAQHKIGLEYKYEDNVFRPHLIKIPAKINGSIEIAETDHALHRLQMAQLGMKTQIEDLEKGIQCNEEKVMQYLKEKKRQLSKTYLRKKKLMEQTLEKRLTALHNIDSLIVSIEEAQSNGEIISAYSYSSKALQNVLNQSGLKYDNVDEVLTNVRDTLDTHREVEDSLANLNLGDASIGSDADLECELADILQKVTEDDKIAAAEQTNGNAERNESLVVINEDDEFLAQLNRLELMENLLPGNSPNLINNNKIQT